MFHEMFREIVSPSYRRNYDPHHILSIARYSANRNRARISPNRPRFLSARGRAKLGEGVPQHLVE
jgi:hypothetical protein